MHFLTTDSVNIGYAWSQKRKIMFDCKSTSSDWPIVVNDQPPCGLQRVSDKGHRINTDISCVGQCPMSIVFVLLRIDVTLWDKNNSISKGRLKTNQMYFHSNGLLFLGACSHNDFLMLIATISFCTSICLIKSKAFVNYIDMFWQETKVC